MAPDAASGLQSLQRNTFRYFWQQTNPSNGLISDNTSTSGIPASIAGVGLALSSYPVAVERSFVSRAQAVERALTTLRFFWNAPHGPMRDATGYQGFFYHFLDVASGLRAWRSELSTIDTAILMAGALTAAAYFDRDTNSEREVRSLADSLYRRVDWRWALNGHASVSHGWKPETGFLRYHWKGYNEALILVRARTGLADASPAREELPVLDVNLSLEEAVRLRISLRRRTVHAPALASVDRLPRHSGCVHAAARD